MITKNKPIRNKKYLKHVQGMPCYVCGCEGEPHHLLRAGEKCMGRKAGDDKVVPLCHHHHMELHRMDEIKFFESNGHKYDSVKAFAKALYESYAKT